MIFRRDRLEDMDHKWEIHGMIPDRPVALMKDLIETHNQIAELEKELASLRQPADGEFESLVELIHEDGCGCNEDGADAGCGRFRARFLALHNALREELVVCRRDTSDLLEA